MVLRLILIALVLTRNLVLAEKDTSIPMYGTQQFAPFFVKPEQLVLLVGTDKMIRFKCRGSGNPEPTVTWTKDGKTLQLEPETKWSIVLNNLTQSDSGKYTCKLCNVVDCVNHTTKLEVLDSGPSKPRFLGYYPRNVTKLVSSEAKLVCRVISELHTTIKWKKFRVVNELDPRIPDDVPVLEDDPGKPGELLFQNVSYADAGWYTCVAKNDVGVSYRSAYLRVVEDFEELEASEQQQRPVLTTTILSVCLGVTLAILGIIVCQKLWSRKHASQSHNLKQLDVSPRTYEDVKRYTGLERQQSRTVLNSIYQSNEDSNYDFPSDLDWELPRDKLILGMTLGEGAFGKVVMADVEGSTQVAVKLLKENHTDSDVEDLMCEMEVMKKIGRHPNIIHLLGCCSTDGPLWIIVEYAPHGNLKDFLRDRRPALITNDKEVLKNSQLIWFALQIARGMEHLSSLKFIHRDLAARNILVSDGHVMKIADFGFARNVCSRDYYHKKTTGKLPTRWMAPESLDRLCFDSQSDVWSFGVLVWEIMTLGDQPYQSIHASDHLLEFLRQGKRLEQPAPCPNDVYLLMNECWYYQPTKRPTFGEIVRHLRLMLSILPAHDRVAVAIDEYV